MSLNPPELSIVIPVFNEEPILRSAIGDLAERLRIWNRSFEILVAENGSSDRTPEIAEQLAHEYAEVRTLSVSGPNYGRALREGIRAARGRFVLCDEIDLCDLDFYERALPYLDRGNIDMVIGSKLSAGSRDERPFMRHAASHVYSWLLRLLVGFRGTDTHGLKAFRRDRVMEVVDCCVVEQDVFASELVVRAQRMGRTILEIPVQIRERRPPTIELFRRVPRVVKSLFRLSRALGNAPH